MSGVQKNTSRLLDTILLKIIVALCVTGIGVSTKAVAGDITFSRSKIFNNVLTKGQFGVSAVVDINCDGKADIVLDNGKWYEGPNWVAHTYSSLDSSLGTESSSCIAALRQFDKPIVCNEDVKTGEEGVAAAKLSVASGASWGLMLERANQHFPFTFNGAADDAIVYAKLKEMTSPYLQEESPTAGGSIPCVNLSAVPVTAKERKI